MSAAEHRRNGKVASCEPCRKAKVSNSYSGTCLSLPSLDTLRSPASHLWTVPASRDYRTMLLPSCTPYEAKAALLRWIGSCFNIAVESEETFCPFQQKPRHSISTSKRQCRVSISDTLASSDT